jgi:hypothetical protein
VQDPFGFQGDVAISTDTITPPRSRGLQLARPGLDFRAEVLVVGCGCLERRRRKKTRERSYLELDVDYARCTYKMTLF